MSEKIDVQARISFNEKYGRADGQHGWIEDGNALRLLKDEVLAWRKRDAIRHCDSASVEAFDNAGIELGNARAATDARLILEAP